MRRPLVSVGVPTWNRPAELTRCLEALLAQTYDALEIIVSDNCSDDPAVAEVLRSFAQRDPRIRCVTQRENIGATGNFQYLLDQASGEFFLWAGDDDRRQPQFVEELVKALFDNPAAPIAFCDFTEVAPTGIELTGRSHLPQLLPFTRTNRVARACAFFFQREHLGKANLIYGLIRRRKLAGFDWQVFVHRYRGWGADMLFVFWLLASGPLALSRDRLYQVTVGNAKWHGEPPVASPWPRRLADRLGLYASQVVYSWQYVRLAPGALRLLMLLLWPVRVLDISARLLALGAIRWTVRALRGSIHGNA